MGPTRVFRACAFACLGIVGLANGAAADCPKLEIAVVNAEGPRTVTGPDGKTLHLQTVPLETIADFTGATVTLTEGQIVVNFNLSAEGAARIRAFSRDHVGTKMAFIAGGEVLKVAKILDPITGDGLLLGPFEKAKADALADAVNKNAAVCARAR